MHKALVQPHLLATVLAIKDPAHPILALNGFRIQLGETRNTLKWC